MKTNQLFNQSNVTISDYINLSQELINDAVDTADVTGNPLVSKIVSKMQVGFNSHPSCDFSAFKMCESIEIWHNQIDECFN